MSINVIKYGFILLVNLSISLSIQKYVWVFLEYYKHSVQYIEMNQNMLFISLQEDKPENITLILKVIYVDKFKRENKCRDCTFLHSFLTTLWASQAQWLNLPYKCRLVGRKQNRQSPRSSRMFIIPYCTHQHMPQIHSSC